MDWSALGFGYIKTKFRYVADYKDGNWNEGGLVTEDKIIISEAAGVLQYAQSVFEGLKAYRTKNNKIVVFRPDLNAERLESSAERLAMPPFPKEKFLQAVDAVVGANRDFVPPYESGASLYLRPYIFGASPVIGVKPAEEYQFRMFATPVGPYFKNEARPLVLKVSDYDRAAPHGTGNVKAGLNYAMSLLAITQAHGEGYDENMYLDPATRTYVEETGGANFIFITKDNKLVTPESDSILPSITRRSLCYVAEKYLGMKVEHRPVRFDELSEFAECGLCGTAAVISPVGKIDCHGKEIVFPLGSEFMGKVTKILYKTLTAIQHGEIEAPEGWLREI